MAEGAEWRVGATLPAGTEMAVLEVNQHEDVRYLLNLKFPLGGHDASFLGTCLLSLTERINAWAKTDEKFFVIASGPEIAVCLERAP